MAIRYGVESAAHAVAGALPAGRRRAGDLMRYPLAILLFCALAAPVLGAELDAACRVRSDYDITVSAGRVLF